MQNHEKPNDRPISTVSGLSDSYTDHQRAMIGAYCAAQRARGFTISATSGGAVEVGLTWSALTQYIPAERIQQVLRQALSDYTYTDVPFGVDHLRQAWFAICDQPSPIEPGLMRMMNCQHDYQWSGERPEAQTIFDGGHECKKCGHFRPRFLSTLSGTARAMVDTVGKGAKE
jgi:hypothetical protein